ncbi:FG-GAP and VCBS repeat-containing protein [Actinopolymorpha alba]|uniref:FG-GAP and VCBS repeat-containing protein n=1 Tax=Actinopolymorpha alba TaxID=533267 RepID=UPI00035D188E|nr:FG-GAP and VCBS repeat-containing protein [Actinopolymorpha alba]
MRRIFGAVPAAFIAVAVVGLALAPNGMAQAMVRTAAPWDFNGDGYQDFVASAPRATVSGHRHAGAIGVLNGSGAGLDLASARRLDQTLEFVPGTPDGGDEFGRVLTSGDFNGDGYADLAVCMPGEDTSASRPKGVLTLMFGSAKGLNRGFNVIAPADLPASQWCVGLASADFNQDGYADLGIVGPRGFVAYGGPRFALPGGVRLNALLAGEYTYLSHPTTGDIDSDGFPDLVLTALEEKDGYAQYLRVYRGGSDGLPTRRPTQDIPIGPPEGHEVLAIAVGDINGDGYAETAVGFNTQFPGPTEGAGEVQVWSGSRTGIVTSKEPMLITQDSPGIPDASEKWDQFGTSLALADVNGDGYAELAIGAPQEGIDASAKAGAVTVIPGSATGPRLNWSTQYSQNTAGILGRSETDDLFGHTVAFRDFNNDGRPELVVGSIGEDDVRNGEGAVHVLRGTRAGLTTGGSIILLPTRFGIAPAWARFGTALG